MATEDSALIHLDCTEPLAQSGIAFDTLAASSNGPLRILQKTRHGEVMEQIGQFGTLSRRELYDVRRKISANLRGLNPTELHGSTRKNFDADCVLLTIVYHVLDPQKYPLLIMRPPQPAGCASCSHDGTTKPLSNCARCRITKYCCRECQKQDWPSHKKWCVVFEATDKKRVYTMISN